jgi:hypothetical protein
VPLGSTAPVAHFGPAHAGFATGAGHDHYAHRVRGIPCTTACEAATGRPRPRAKSTALSVLNCAGADGAYRSADRAGIAGSTVPHAE